MPKHRWHLSLIQKTFNSFQMPFYFCISLCFSTADRWMIRFDISKTILKNWCLLEPDSTMVTIIFHLLFWKLYQITKYSHFCFYIFVQGGNSTFGFLSILLRFLILPLKIVFCYKITLVNFCTDCYHCRPLLPKGQISKWSENDGVTWVCLVYSLFFWCSL